MKKRSGLKVMMHLIGLVKPLAFFMILAIIMGLIGNLSASFITIFGGYAVADIIGINVPFSLTTIFISVCIFAIIRGIFRYAEQACNHYIAFKLLALIREKVFKALRKLCPAKLECKDKGNLISIITSDIELLEVFYAHTISPVIIAFLYSVIMCVFIGNYSLILSFIALTAYITVGVIVPIITSKQSGNNSMYLRKKSGQLSGYVLDNLRGLSEVLQYNQGKKRLDEMNNYTDNLSSYEKTAKQLSGKNQAITNALILIFDLAILFTSALLYKFGKIDFIGVIIPTITMMSSFGPVVALANLGSTLQNTFASGNRVLDILDETPVVEEIKGKLNVDFKEISAENVTFAYENENILDNVSLKIQKSSVIGIVGKSGSGKSTLLKLFMRFWQSEKGTIKISNTDINEINTENLRNMESLVTQETHLFHDSIRNNIRIAKLNATDKEIELACKKASVHNFIMNLPQGYNTQVGELGDTLSGGERQRIGLARAFLHNADLMLLDEPTSNLDSLNEAVILKSLKKERENKTVVLVSHRQSTMRIVDKVYSVENGRMS